MLGSCVCVCVHIDFGCALRGMIIGGVSDWLVDSRCRKDLVHSGLGKWWR